MRTCETKKWRNRLFVLGQACHSWLVHFFMQLIGQNAYCDTFHFYETMMYERDLKRNLRFHFFTIMRPVWYKLVNFSLCLNQPVWEHSTKPLLSSIRDSTDKRRKEQLKNHRDNVQVARTKFSSLHWLLCSLQIENRNLWISTRPLNERKKSNLLWLLARNRNWSGRYCERMK